VLDIPVPKGCLMILLLSGYDGGLGPGARELEGCGSRQGSQWPLLIAMVQRIEVGMIRGQLGIKRVGLIWPKIKRRWGLYTM
jgi:hypothetical protein